MSHFQIHEQASIIEKLFKIFLFNIHAQLRENVLIRTTVLTFRGDLFSDDWLDEEH